MSDGNVQAAKTRMGRAVDALCKPRLAVYHTGTYEAPSLYDCLRSDLAGTQGDTRTPAKSLPPVWIDAVMLLDTIDVEARHWTRRRNVRDSRTTPQRLLSLPDLPWRPQDTDKVVHITNNIDNWTETIKHLLDPQSVKTLSAPCPTCNKQWVHRRDSAGDLVRQPALQVVASVGASCLVCGAHWAPDRYMFLCRLLGFELPAGVLE
jgi:hypothetical protein